MLPLLALPHMPRLNTLHQNLEDALEPP